MRDYKVFYFENQLNKNYIFLNNTDDPYFFMEDIYNSISQKQGKKFSVIIDLFLRNGYSFNRYILVNFEDGNHRTIIVNPNDVSEECKKIVRQYLKDNKTVLHNGVLTDKVINYVLNQ